MTRCRFAAAVAAFALLILPARGAEVLRVAMTVADIPTTTGMPNNGFEGMRFLGYPIFEGLVLWDLASADRLAGLRPGLAERYEQAADRKTWIFHLRHGVKFHDGTGFNADAVIWNLDRYFKNDSPQFEPAGAGMTRARVPVIASYRKIDDFTVAISTKEPERLDAGDPIVDVARTFGIDRATLYRLRAQAAGGRDGQTCGPGDNRIRILFG
jgi:peptide/nickel transport system substrate-binding protein